MTRRSIKLTISNAGTRNEVRRRVVDAFFQEEPGTGSGELASRYDYIVEGLPDGRDVILTRPANLKLGFDFLIRVEDFDFSDPGKRYRDYPSHDDLLDDLNAKKGENPDAYKHLYTLIERVYECEEVTVQEAENVPVMDGFSVAMILGIVKWFFIEQDIRYWNYSGRGMLFSSIPKP